MPTEARCNTMDDLYASVCNLFNDFVDLRVPAVALNRAKADLAGARALSGRRGSLRVAAACLHGVLCGIMGVRGAGSMGFACYARMARGGYQAMCHWCATAGLPKGGILYIQN